MSVVTNQINDVIKRIDELFIPTKTSEILNDSDFSTNAILETKIEETNLVLKSYTNSEINSHNIDTASHFAKFESKFDVAKANSLIANVSYDPEKGVFTYKRVDNTEIIIDLPIEGVVEDGYFDEENQEIVLLLLGGKEIRIPASGLVDVYSGDLTNTIQTLVSTDNIISAHIIGGSIEKNLLSEELQETISELQEKSHYHSNKELLDNLKQDDINKWNVTDNAVDFTVTTSRSNIITGEKLSVLFGKISKWLLDLKSLAFKNSVSKTDLDTSLQAEIDNKVEKITGKQLSNENYTLTEKNKLNNIEAAAQINVIENIQKNGVDLTITNKVANITVPTGAIANKDTITNTDIATNASIEKSKLSSEVQSTLNKADTALQNIPDATAMVKGATLLGATNGAARYGQKSDVGLANVPNIDTTNPANISWTSNYRVVTDTQISNWNASTAASGVSGVKGNAESVYRTGNVNITAANIGAAPTSHQHDQSSIVQSTTYNVTNGVSRLNAPLISEMCANKLAFIDPKAVTVEFSNDGGTTWTVANSTEVTDTQKVGLFVGINGYTNIPLGASTGGAAGAYTVGASTRITIDSWAGGTSNERYFGGWTNTYMWISTNGAAGMNVTIEKSTIEAPETFTVIRSNVPLAGWSNSNDICHSEIIYGGGISQPNQNRKIRWTFKITGVNSLYQRPVISGIRAYGNAMWMVPSGAHFANNGHMYTWDIDKSVSFPAAVHSPTPVLSDSSTTLATTAFVKGQGYLTSVPDATTTIKGISTISNNLTTSTTGTVLDASQGKILKDTKVDKFSLPFGGNISYIKIAELTTAIGSGCNNIILYINGTSDYGNNTPGVDILQASTRGSISLKCYNFIPQGTEDLLYGYIENTTTNKTEIWLKRETYHTACSIIVAQAYDPNSIKYGILLEQNSEPDGIVYVKRQPLVFVPDVTGKEDKSNKGIAGGYASLNESGQIPIEQIPSSGTNTIQVVDF